MPMRPFDIPSATRGLEVRNVDVRVIPTAAFGEGDVVEFDHAQSDAGTTDNAIGVNTSGNTRVIAPTASGRKHSRVHGIAMQPLVVNKPGYVRIVGVVTVNSDQGFNQDRGFVIGQALPGSNHGKRVKGLVISAGSEKTTLIWDGIEGFGTVWEPASSSGSSSGGSSGGSSGSSGACTDCDTWIQTKSPTFDFSLNQYIVTIVAAAESLTEAQTDLAASSFPATVAAANLCGFSTHEREVTIMYDDFVNGWQVATVNEFLALPQPGTSKYKIVFGCHPEKVVTP